MELTLGDKIKINGEEVPEYLLKALHSHLNTVFEPKWKKSALLANSIAVNHIACSNIETSSSKFPSDKYIIR
ncbi:hypothetical protein A4G18_00515 [Pasteurellaceae bacterium Pebbles2]|nr:hypothetical protein [Pasteurellaceae bacterium Pebbles2]